MNIPARPKDPQRRYEHRFHAGNAGDVWKHVVLLALLGRCRPGVTYVETHAGSGRYALGPTGEWQEGVGRLLAADRTSLVAPVRAYLDAVAPRDVDVRRGLPYPGSPLLAARALDPSARLVLHEIEPTARTELGRALGADGRATVVGADGVTALGAGLVHHLGDTADPLVVIDPPFHTKGEWTDVPAALLQAARALPAARFLFWYPIKAHTRPNAMLAHLRTGGLGATAVELITAPLAARKNRLAGSGMVLVRPPEGLLEEVAAAAAALGPRLCLHPDLWSHRITSWGPGAPDA